MADILRDEGLLEVGSFITEQGTTVQDKAWIKVLLSTLPLALGLY